MSILKYTYTLKEKQDLVNFTGSLSEKVPCKPKAAANMNVLLEVEERKASGVMIICILTLAKKYEVGNVQLTRKRTIFIERSFIANIYLHRLPFLYSSIHQTFTSSPF